MGNHNANQKAARGWNSAVTTSLAGVVALAACASDSQPEAGGARGQPLFGVQAQNPRLQEMLEGARRQPAEQRGVSPDSKFRVVSWRPTPTPPSHLRPEEAEVLLKALRNSGYGLYADLPAEAAGPLVIHSHAAPGPLKITRIGGTNASGVLEQGSVVYRNATPGTDSIVLSGEGAIEELLVVREGEPDLGYQLSLPAGTFLKKVARDRAELRDRDGHAWLRFAARRAWDSAGKEVPPTVEVEGLRIRLRLPEGVSLPVIVDPSWEATDMMSESRASQVAALLPSGRVLLAGGCKDTTQYDDAGGTLEKLCTGALSSADLFDPLRGDFSATASMTEPRHSASAVVLNSGWVLIAGGCGDNNCGSQNDIAAEPAQALSSAELFDPGESTGTPAFKATGSMLQGRLEATATRLTDGRVLVVGGFSSGQDGSKTLASAEIYTPEGTDPAKGGFAATGSLKAPRARHTATLLGDGRVLIVGGMSTDGSAVRSAEVWDPADNQFHLISAEMPQPRCQHTATRAPDGSVLIAGGCQGSCNDKNCTDVTSATVVFKPGPGDSGVFTEGPVMSSTRRDHMATLLPTGRVLIVGGCKNQYCGSMGNQVRNSEEFDPATGLFVASADASTIRHGATATTLPTGKVLLAGGRGTSPPLPSAEIYDPNGGQVQSEPSALLPNKMTRRRIGHSATLLPSGEVLIVGGIAVDPSIYPIAEAELFDPTSHTFTAPESAKLHDKRLAHTATLLATGEVLVLGGCTSPLCGQASQPVGLVEGDYFAEIYSPATKAFRAAKGKLPDTPPHGRIGHTVTQLPDGKLLIVAGCGDVGCARPNNPHLKDLWLFDPKTEAFASVEKELENRRGLHSTTVLENGLVAVIGGRNQDGTIPATELFNPAPGLVETIAGPIFSRSGHGAALGARQRVALMGGMTAVGTTDVTDTVEHYNPSPLAVDSWPTLPMGVARFWMISGPVELLSGGLLVAGNCSSQTCEADKKTAVEVFEPVAIHGQGRFGKRTALAMPRSAHTATRLLNGQVLITGGCDVNPAEIDPYTLKLCASDVYDTAELLTEWDPKSPPMVARPVAVPTSLTATIGETVTLKGGGFARPVGAGSGRTNDSAANNPVALWFPEGGGYPVLGAVTAWSDEAATWHVPLTTRTGPGWLHVVVQGVPSVGVPLTLLQAKTGSRCGDVGAQCESGFCKDNVCCQEACEGACGVCSVAAGAQLDGHCAPAPAGTWCSSPEPGSCGGSCDNGKCTAVISCAPGWCDKTIQRCAFTCSQDTDCAEAAFCGEGKSCVAPKPKGAACDRDRACLSGFCTSGVCCAKRDCGNYACSAATGECFDSCDSDKACATDNRCELTSGQCVSGAVCVGDFGVSDRGKEYSCAPYRCKAGACQSRCMLKSECALGYTCDRPTQTCIRTDEPRESNLGCSCSTPGARESDPRTALLGIAIAAAGLRRRSRRKTRIDC